MSALVNAQPMTYEETKQKFAAWAASVGFDPKDRDLFDAFLAGVYCSEAALGVEDVS
jgi:hypothetical protein